jgi:hypothetical protein
MLQRFWHPGAVSAIPILHVKHDDTLPSSTYRPGQFKPEAAPPPGETVIVKHTNSAVIGTELDRLLRQAGVHTLVIMRVINNNSVEATVRMAGNLGFETYLVEVARFTFARPRRPLLCTILAGFQRGRGRLLSKCAMRRLLQPSYAIPSALSDTPTAGIHGKANLVKGAL